MTAQTDTAQDLGYGHGADLLTVTSTRTPDGSLERDTTHLAFAVAEDAIATLDGFEAGSVDHITMISVLEHAREPRSALDDVHRVLAPGRTASVHVPTWLCRPVPEALAFRHSMSTDGHRCSFYRAAQLRPMALRAGFRPTYVRMRYALLGFVLRADLRKPPACAPWR